MIKRIFILAVIAIAGFTAVAQIVPLNPGDVLRKMSNRVNDGIQERADLLSPQDQQVVMNLLSQIRERLQVVDPGNDSILANSQTAGPVSRKVGGEWMTITLPQAMIMSKIGLRAIGETKIRIYRVNLVNYANENIALNINGLDIIGNSGMTQNLNISTPIKYIQILAESFGPAMYIGVDSFTPSHGDNPPPPFQPPVPVMDLTCISRDNDGMAPFILAARNPVDFSVTKFVNVKFPSTGDCNSAIQNITNISGNSFLCSSRDGDGLAPFTAFAFILNDIRKLESLKFSTIVSCRTSLVEARVTPVVFGMCSSRDGDGMAPWLIYTVNHESLQVVPHKDVTYQSYQSCRSAM